MKPMNWQRVERIFLASRADTCPYLPEQREQKLVTLIQDGDTDSFAELTDRGFRRSHQAAYHPICPNCQACKALRVRVQDFRPNKTQRRLLRRYANLHLAMDPPVVDAAHWALFRAYVRARHPDGSMAAMTQAAFAEMVSDTPVETRLMTWRDGGPDGTLVAACIADLLPNGLSAVYSYFSVRPAYPSLGTFVILDLIQTTAKAGLDHLHLGYWVKGAKTMAYKAQFHPCEIYSQRRWQVL